MSTQQKTMRNWVPWISAATGIAAVYWYRQKNTAQSRARPSPRVHEVSDSYVSESLVSRGYLKEPFRYESGKENRYVVLLSY